MRIVEIGDRKIEVMALTPRQIKDLGNCGFGLAVCIPTLKTANEAKSRGIEFAVNESDLEYLMDRPLSDTTLIWKALLAETYGAPDEEKNLPGTSDGSQTETGSNTVKAAVPEQESQKSA